MTNLLYSSTSFAGVPLRNRIVYPPITTGFADQEGKVSDRMVEYYRQRASGGVGLLTTEMLCAVSGVTTVLIHWLKGL
ncbi:hypothetical protein [Desulfosporosinus hippei]|uniref:NADH:flavin oxidoreductase / NADH oxidase family protein n=1 Tax=Desulfosporosinus hippei DSM 8344 TaxID=1121419 RepID=A0A1G7W3G7_9FIRM|nr:hypothetical protein [Desulfosporosinus hippei]SDG66585.1 NADH:flavin oxidoreductase / NADH oxidase family protein [Desulfosporosinus hippei DSM 8344]